MVNGTMSDNNEPLDLQKIEARLKAATPGPWHWNGDYEDLMEEYGPHWILGTPDLTHIGLIAKTAESYEEGSTNIEFIANAPTDIAALVAEVHKLRRKINRQAEQDHLEYCGEDELFFPPYPDEVEE